MLYLPDHLEATAMHVYATTQSQYTGHPFLRKLAWSLSTLLTLSIVSFSTHSTAATLIEKDGLLESKLDELLAAWPTKASDFDSTELLLQELAAELTRVFQPTKEAHLRFNLITPPRTKTVSRRHLQPTVIEGLESRDFFQDENQEIHFESPKAHLPYTPTYFGTHCRTPIPGRRAYWSDFIVVDIERQRCHATRFNEHSELHQIAVMFWNSSTWHALEFTYQPDGKPQKLEVWRNKEPDAFRAVWDTQGALNLQSFDEQQHATTGLVPCSISVSFSDPRKDKTSARAASPDRFESPYAAITMLPKGQATRIDAPPLESYEFAGWSGDADGALPTTYVTATEPVHLVAHYVWPNLRGGDPYRRFSNTVDVRIQQDSGITPESRTSFDLMNIQTLDLSDSIFEDEEDLQYFHSLRELNVSRIPMLRAFQLSHHFAIEQRLKAQTWQFSPGLLTKVSLALHSAQSPPIQKLVANNTAIEDLKALAFLPDLRHVELRHCGLTNLQFLSGLEKLKTLELSDNLIQDISQLSTLPAPPQKTVLARNHIMTLEALVKRPAWPVGTELDVTENKLSPIAIQQTIPTLKERQLNVHFSHVAFPNDAIDHQDDSDGDGYTDEDEWRYATIMATDIEARYDRYREAVANPTIPSEHLKQLPNAKHNPDGSISLDTIPTVEMRIYVKGRGEVYPGPGSHRVAIQMLDATGELKTNRILLDPEGQEGWAAEPLLIPVTPIAGQELVPGSTVHPVPLNPEYAMNFRFRRVYEAVEVDLVGALSTFLKEHFPDDDIFSFDQNGLNDQLRKPDEPTENGMPDLVELLMLQRLLRTPLYNEYSRHGLRFSDVVQRWELNHAIARRAIGDQDSEAPHLALLLAAQATMGHWEPTRATIALIRNTTGQEIAPGQFPQGFGRNFPPDMNFRKGLDKNSVRWNRLLRGRTVTQEIIDVFLDDTFSH